MGPIENYANHRGITGRAGLYRGSSPDVTRASHVKFASRFCRIAYHMVAGSQVFHHPTLSERGYIFDKLLTHQACQQARLLHVGEPLVAAVARER